MSGSRVVFYDLETGGLDPSRHPVIQYAGIAVDEAWNELETLEVKLEVNESRCDPEALAGNCYDRATWERKAIPPSLAVTRISAFMRGHSTLAVPKRPPKRGVWYACETGGHNVTTFDGPFLRALFKAHGEFCVAAFLALDTLPLSLWWAKTTSASSLPRPTTRSTTCARRSRWGSGSWRRRGRWRGADLDG